MPKRLFKNLQVGLVALALICFIVVVVMETLLFLYKHKHLQSRFINLPPLQVSQSPLPESFRLTAPVGESSMFARADIQNQWLVHHFAPVLIQGIGRKPAEDIPIAIDFDGDNDPVNNGAHFKDARSVTPVVYGEVTAETEDSFYLTYLFYYIADYDHPFRELLADWTFHEQDMEGFHIRVDKNTLSTVGIETWYHDRFLYCNKSLKSAGPVPVLGYMQLYNDTNPIVFSTAGGHAIRCAYAGDWKPATVMLIAPATAAAAAVPLVKENLHLPGSQIYYDLQPMSVWQVQAQSQNFYEDWVSVGQRKSDHDQVRLGRYLRSTDHDKNPLCRPKPPWSWGGVFDTMPIGYWYLFPARSFARYSSAPLSQTYVAHGALDQLTSMKGERALAEIDFTSQKESPVDFWDFNDRPALWNPEHTGMPAPLRFLITRLHEYVNVIFVSLDD